MHMNNTNVGSVAFDQQTMTST